MAATLELLVGHFKSTRAHYRDGSIELCVAAGTLEEAIRRAAMAAHPRWKKHIHQRRLPDDVLESVSARLLTKIYRIQSATTFDDLHGIVASCAVAGFAEMAIYDTALRLGMRLKKPLTAVYLHAGTRKGAEALSRNFAGGRLNLSKDILQMNELPAPLQQLAPAEVEDFLCVYKKYLQDRTAPPDNSPSGNGCCATSDPGRSGC
ncbi:hypothetical protein ACN6A1_06145 [Myxococcus virescens]|uniref:hypothetical protein n=1 Tax=Myxococcus virescens TaxID=83456 RepID=UPI003DA63915